MRCPRCGYTEFRPAHNDFLQCGRCTLLGEAEVINSWWFCQSVQTKGTGRRGAGPRRVKVEVEQNVLHV